MERGKFKKNNMNVRKNKNPKKYIRKQENRNYVKKFGSPDRILFGVIFLLVIFGLIMIANAGVLQATVRLHDSNFFFRNQLISVVVGFISLLILQKIDYHIFSKYAIWILVVAIGLLFLVFLPGIGVETGSSYTAKRWINVAGFSFQPSEAVKLAVILYFSAWCSAKGAQKIRDVKEGLQPFLIILGVISFLIYLQPDVGTMGIIIVIATSIFFFAGANIKHLIGVFFVGIVLFGVVIYTSEYRMSRVMTFLHPENDALNSGYQINQAYTAFGVGGVFGLGPGHNEVHLPEPVGDSIYAAIGEEFGFFGAVALLFVFLFLLFRIFRIAMLSEDMFGRLVAGGIGVWIVGQGVMNMGAISGLMPLTGIPLPFISYGGSSVFLMLSSIGIVLNISRQRQNITNVRIS